jgi:hypothetical protein
MIEEKLNTEFFYDEVEPIPGSGISAALL